MNTEIQRAIKYHFYSATEHPETDFQIAKAILDIEDVFTEGDRKYVDYVADVAERNVWKDALPVIGRSLNTLDSLEGKGKQNLELARQAVDKKINPKLERSEIESLLHYLKEKEIRETLGSLDQAERLKIIDKALEKNDRFLLDAMLAAPFFIDEMEQELLTKKKTEYELEIAQKVCQQEFEILQDVKKLNEKLSQAIVTAKNAIYHIVHGRWKIISSELRGELLGNVSTKNILQSAGIDILK